MKIRVFNPKMKNRIGVFLLVSSDILTLSAFFYLSAFIRDNIIPLVFHEVPVFEYGIGMYYWIFPIWFFILAYEGAYSKRFAFWDEAKLLSKCTLFASLTIFTVLFIGKQGAAFSRILLLTMSLLSLLLFPLIRTSIKRLLYSFGLMKRKVLILGTGEAGRLALAALRNEPNLGYDVAGFIDEEPNGQRDIDGVRIHRYIDKIDRYIKRGVIHDIVIAKPELDKQRLVRIINAIQHKVENTLYIPDISGIAVLGTELRHFFNEQTIVIEIKNNLARPFNYMAKRLFDYTAGSILFLLLIIPILIISILIRITSKGPAIFMQQRIGRGGRPFMCYKFRTMYQDAEERLKGILETDSKARAEWEEYWKFRNDPRVTGLGNFLRKTSLDELPQIFNVLKGEMSLVGPRPYLPRERDFLKEFAEVILSVPPGITGLWQVSGRSNTSYKYRVSLDAWYVRNWNLWLDIVILIKTIRVVLKKEGAS
ncbi:Undecaprenyl-phosphate glycophosphotransferase [hydrothermal vent metagenome]|uniref:Undecaprenyl-phosphate glycophosphotransferase n=1 Tax=hydrothermal vent metagenome TaxID=652676 RepID=A0A3B1DZN1_9ZZZZ